ncbi:universal stress protein [Alcaligenaceae bacterium]|nr:universal stress protein [Alcaligenaceae bacterium]
MPKILACLDTSAYAESVCDVAAWAAARLAYPVELLHVVQRKSAVAMRNDFSGAIGLGVKSSLLQELTEIEEAEAKLAVESGRALLSAAADRLRSAGLTDIAVTHRHGGIVETIIEREADCAVVVMGKRGASREFASAHMGSKIERVLRASSKPTLIAPLKVGPIKNAIIAFDGGASAKRALDLVLTSPLFAGMAPHVIMAGTDNEENRAVLEAVRQRFADAGTRAETVLLSGMAEAAISDYMDAHAESVLVMGAYGHSPLRNMIVGSTTTSVIRMISVPILLVR